MEAIHQLGMGTDAKLLLQYTTRRGCTSPGERVERRHGARLDPTSRLGELARRAGQGWPDHGVRRAGRAAPRATVTHEPHGAAPATARGQILAHIDDVVPGTAVALQRQAWLDYWTDDPWTRGSYAAFAPGQYDAVLAASTRSRAAASTSPASTPRPTSQGFLNGGVERGQRAAIEIMQGAGVTVPPAIANLPYSTD